MFEVLQDAKSRLSDFRIRLTYTLPDESAKSQHLGERNGSIKRRKTGTLHVFFFLCTYACDDTLPNIKS